MQAITLAVPPQTRQVSTSRLNTRLSRPLKGPTFGVPRSLTGGVMRAFSHPARLRLFNAT